jgi:cytosine/adenosine deaminase-related metal-dependent hydrolase
MNTRRILIHAAAIADGAGQKAAPGAILIEGDCIVAAGRPQEIGHIEGTAPRALPTSVVIPALVNAHAHLDLTHIGASDFNGDFTQWIDSLRIKRHRAPEGIADSVRHGVRLSRAGGTALIGDIAGVRSDVPTRTLREQGLAGVSFLEVFGMGRGQQTAIEVMRDAARSIPHRERGVRLGLQPHAPYSCGPEVYRAAGELARQAGLPLSTHLAESSDEVRFAHHADGALAHMLRRLGVWDETIAPVGKHPIDHVAEVLGRVPCVAAHVNYAQDHHLSLLSLAHISVAYCPRASAYFNHPGSHRYREMLAAGVNVALGTDSIICLDTPDRLSVLDDMRLLWRRDRTDPAALLRMATVNGAKALGVLPSLFTLQPGPIAGLLAIECESADNDPLIEMLAGDSPSRWLHGPVAARDDWFVPQ